MNNNILLALSLSAILAAISCNKSPGKATMPPAINTDVGNASPSSAFEHIGQPHVDPSIQIGDDIRCIFQDSKGIYWFATNGKGVCRYDGNTIAYLQDKDGLVSNYLGSIQEDNAGNLWFGSSFGISKYDGKTFTNYNTDPNAPNAAYVGKFENTTGEVWFGAENGAIHFNGLSFTSLKLPMSPADEQLRKSNPGYNRTAYSTYCLLQDKAGNIWFGTEQKGVYRYDGHNFTHYTDHGLGRGAIRSIFQDSKGNIWVGSNGGGVAVFDGESFSNFSEDKALSNNLMTAQLDDESQLLNRVWSIVEDKSGNIWFGTVDEGAWRYDGSNLHNFNTQNGLTSNSIWTLFVDNKGLLWLGTERGGVCTFDGKSFVNFTK